MQSTLIAQILERVHMNDLPALAENAEEIKALAQNNRATNQSFSVIIFKDLALVCRIMRIINSAYYKRTHQIASVSTAVNTLGTEDLNNLAANSLILENYIKAGMEQDLAVKHLTRAIVSALFAQNLCTQLKLPLSSEEAYSCALLRPLGEISLLLYFPDLYHKILEMNERGAETDEASWVVLRGYSLSNLGKEIARSWNFPEIIISAMTHSPGKPSIIHDRAAFYPYLAAFSDEFVRAVCRKQRINKVLAKFGDYISVGKDDALDLLKKSIRTAKNLSKVYRNGVRLLQLQSAVNISLSPKASSDSHARHSPAPPPHGGDSIDATGTDANVSTQAINDDSTASTGYNLRPNNLNDYIYLLHKNLRHDFQLKKALVLLAVGLLKSTNATRFMIMHLSAGPSGKRFLTSGFGMGETPSGKYLVLDPDLSISSNIITECLADGKDRTLLSGETAEGLPENIKKLFKGRTVYLLPLTVSRQVIGILYIDHSRAEPAIPEQQHETIQFMRDLAQLAIAKDLKLFFSLAKPER